MPNGSCSASRSDYEPAVQIPGSRPRGATDPPPAVGGVAFRPERYLRRVAGVRPAGTAAGCARPDDTGDRSDRAGAAVEAPELILSGGLLDSVRRFAPAGVRATGYVPVTTLRQDGIEIHTGAADAHWAVR